jgi:uncharacterized protein YeaC (DUF1315 family)
MIVMDFTDQEILKQWFDITSPITESDTEDCIEQMMLYAIKENEDPEHHECKAQYRKMRRAIKKHNESF